MMVARFVRAQAWWRLDTPGVSAIRAARCVVSLLDAAGCISGLPEDHPDLQQLAQSGCFADGHFDPGPAATAVVRGWELADEPTGATQDLLAALAVTVSAPRASAPHGALPAAPLPAPIVPEPAFAPDTVVFGQL
jgi:hypothetical protein